VKSSCRLWHVPARRFAAADSRVALAQISAFIREHGLAPRWWPPGTRRNTAIHDASGPSGPRRAAAGRRHHPRIAHRVRSGRPGRRGRSPAGRDRHEPAGGQRAHAGGPPGSMIGQRRQLAGLAGGGRSARSWPPGPGRSSTSASSLPRLPGHRPGRRRCVRRECADPGAPQALTGRPGRRARWPFRRGAAHLPGVCMMASKYRCSAARSHLRRLAAHEPHVSEVAGVSSRRQVHHLAARPGGGAWLRPASGRRA